MRKRNEIERDLNKAMGAKAMRARDDFKR